MRTPMGTPQLAQALRGTLWSPRCLGEQRGIQSPGHKSPHEAGPRMRPRGAGSAQLGGLTPISPPQDPPPSASPPSHPPRPQSPVGDSSRRRQQLGQEAALFGEGGGEGGSPRWKPLEGVSFPHNDLEEVDAGSHHLDGQPQQRPEALDTDGLQGEEASWRGGNHGDPPPTPPSRPWGCTPAACVPSPGTPQLTSTVESTQVTLSTRWLPCCGTGTEQTLMTCGEWGAEHGDMRVGPSPGWGPPHHETPLPSALTPSSLNSQA